MQALKLLIGGVEKVVKFADDMSLDDIRRILQGKFSKPEVAESINKLRKQRMDEFGVDAYHGSTHNIKAMDGSISNPESDWGRSTYTTTSAEDASVNYAGKGADLTNRIDSEAETISQDMFDDEYVRDELLDEHGFTLEQYENDEAGIANAIASKRLMGSNEGVVYPLKVNTDKYARIGGRDSSKLEGRDYWAEAEQNIDRKDYASDYDYQDALDEERYALENDDYNGLYAQIKRAIEDTDGYQNEQALDEVMMSLTDDIADGQINITDLDSAIRENFTDNYNDMGEMLSSGEISSQVLKNLGFEGVIDNTVNAKFGYGRQYGRGMEGIDATTQHIVTFPGFEKNIRSTSADFNPTKRNSSNLLDSKLLPTAGAGLLANEAYDNDTEAGVVAPLTKLISNLKKKNGVKTLNLYETKNGDIKLDTLIVDKDKRKQGVGSEVMEEIAEYADNSGKRVVLSPAVKDDYQGTTSRNRLVKFYKRHDFVENKGRNKDFRISESMMRIAKKYGIAPAAVTSAMVASEADASLVNAITSRASDMLQHKPEHEANPAVATFTESTTDLLSDGLIGAGFNKQLAYESADFINMLAGATGTLGAIQLGSDVGYGIRFAEEYLKNNYLFGNPITKGEDWDKAIKAQYSR